MRAEHGPASQGHPPAQSRRALLLDGGSAAQALRAVCNRARHDSGPQAPWPSERHFACMGSQLCGSEWHSRYYWTPHEQERSQEGRRTQTGWPGDERTAGGPGSGERGVQLPLQRKRKAGGMGSLAAGLPRIGCRVKLASKIARVSLQKMDEVSGQRYARRLCPQEVPGERRLRE